MRARVQIFLAFAALVVGALIGMAVTGYERRAYPTLPPDATLTLAGQTLTVAELAERYQPQLFLRAGTQSPPLLWVWYEAIANAEAATVSLVYYHAWQAEINPNPVVDVLYAGFRALYYGYPLYDIEYQQIDVALADGAVQRLRFETGAVDDFYTVVSDHRVETLERQPNGLYRRELRDRAGTLLQAEPDVDFRVDGGRLRMGVQTWNHLSVRLSDTSEAAYPVPVPLAPLRALTDEDYARYRFVRKSQGDHRTVENPLARPAATVAGAAALYAIVTGLRRRRRP